MFDLGDQAVDDTLYLPFDTYDSDGASVTITGLAVTDIEIYKDGSATTRASDNGYALLDTDGIDFASTTGLHGFSVDLSDNSDSGFYAAGGTYWCNVNAITVDSQTVRFTYRFTIGKLLRPTTAGRTITVEADGDVAKVNLLNGHTAQTGDTFGKTAGLTSFIDVLAGLAGTHIGSTAQNEINAAGSGSGTYDGSTDSSQAVGDRVTAIKVPTDKMVFTVANQLDVNMLSISSDGPAADNLESMYDGTGYTSSDTAPASRSQVDNIGAATGGAIAFAPSSDNTSGAIINSITKVWATVAGTFANVENDDGSSHDFTDSADVIDHVYGFSVGGGRQGVSVAFKCNVDGNNDTILMKVYDHVGVEWDTIATIEGSGGTVNRTGNPRIFSKHTGTGSELGNVYVRFDTDSTTPSDLSVEVLNVEAVNIGQTIGYANGSIWVDTNNGVAGTEAFVNGVADNPTNLIASAKTISSAVGISDFHIINGSSITLAEDSSNESYFGDNWTLILAVQTVTDAHFQGANVSGTHVGPCEFSDCKIGTITTIAETDFDNCELTATITLPVGSVYLNNCHHQGTPVLDFGAAVGSTTVHMHKYAGGIDIQNMGDTGTDILHLDGKGSLTLNANSSGGTINLRGEWKITDSAGGAITVNQDDVATDVAATLVDTADMQPKLGTPAGASMSVDIAAIPTLAEMNTAHGLLATEAKQDVSDANIVLILADTGELQTDWADGGRLDLIQDIIAVDTTTDIPALIATLQTSVNDVPTVAEFNARTIVSASYFDPANDTVALVTLVTLVTTTTTVTNQVTADVTALNGVAASAVKLERSASTIVTGAAEAGTLSTTVMTTDLTEITNDHYNGRVLIWTSGVLAGQGTDITDYLGSTGQLTYTAVTEAPSAADTFVIV